MIICPKIKKINSWMRVEWNEEKIDLSILERTHTNTRRNRLIFCLVNFCLQCFAAGDLIPNFQNVKFQFPWNAKPRTTRDWQPRATSTLTHSSKNLPLFFYHLLSSLALSLLFPNNIRRIEVFRQIGRFFHFPLLEIDFPLTHSASNVRLCMRLIQWMEFSWKF